MQSLRNINTPSYKEIEALRELLNAVDEMLDIEAEHDEAGTDSREQVPITLSGKTFAFYASTITADALCAFVLRIAEEQGYEVDINANTVLDKNNVPG